MTLPWRSYAHTHTHTHTCIQKDVHTSEKQCDGHQSWSTAQNILNKLDPKLIHVVLIHVVLTIAKLHINEFTIGS